MRPRTTTAICSAVALVCTLLIGCEHDPPDRQCREVPMRWEGSYLPPSHDERVAVDVPSEHPIGHGEEYWHCKWTKESIACSVRPLPTGVKGKPAAHMFLQCPTTVRCCNDEPCTMFERRQSSMALRPSGTFVYLQCIPEEPEWPDE